MRPTFTGCLAITALVFLAGLIVGMQSCAGDPPEPVLVAVKPEPLQLTANAVANVDTARVADSLRAEVRLLLRERERLRTRLQGTGATVILRTDTILGHDTIRIECDEISRTQSFAVRFGERLVPLRMPAAQAASVIEYHIEPGLMYDFAHVIPTLDAVMDMPISPTYGIILGARMWYSPETQAGITSPPLNLCLRVAFRYSL